MFYSCKLGVLSFFYLFKAYAYQTRESLLKATDTHLMTVHPIMNVIWVLKTHSTEMLPDWLSICDIVHCQNFKSY